MAAVGGESVRGIAAAAVVCLALAGCGSSSPKSSTKASTPTIVATAPAQAAPAPAPPGSSKPSYRAAANRICRQARGRLVPLHSKAIAAQKAGNPAVVLKRFGTVSQQTATVYDDTVGKLQALGTPSTDQGGKAAQLNTLLAQLATIMHGLSNAAVAQDRARVAQLSMAAGRAADHYTSAARAYGLRTCGGIAQLAVARRGNR